MLQVQEHSTVPGRYIWISVHARHSTFVGLDVLTVLTINSTIFGFEKLCSS